VAAEEDADREVGSIRSMTRRLAWNLVVLTALCAAVPPTRAEQTSFGSPEAAVSALTAALARDDVDALIDIFGREHPEVVLGVDPASGRVMRERAAAAAREKTALRRDGESRFTLMLGNNAWPMPVPMIRKGERWRFDTDAGLDEMLARRIGEDELAAIDALETFVAAERRYASWRRARGDPPEYARFIQSTPGDTDGLWWDQQTAARVGASPLAAFAAKNAEFLRGRRPGDPFRGYYFRVLTGQGRHAPGGAITYLEGGRMTKGFAMIAWPADYGASGVKTFVVGPDGRVLEQDLGEETASRAQGLLVYYPDAAWTPAEKTSSSQ
jgi:hypothetical protein